MNRKNFVEAWNKVVTAPLTRSASYYASHMGQATVTRIEPTHDGWYEWDVLPPPKGILIRLRYYDGDHTTNLGIGYSEDMHRYWNLAGMEWCLTGIGREQLLARSVNGAPR